MKILIIDDEVVSRMKLQKLIQSLGYEPIVAEDGKKGYDIWKSERPRVVLTDWMMPGMDGVQLCRAIRKNEGSQYTFILMITSKEETRDIVTSMDAGADDFITKPFIKEELAVRIRAALRILDFESRDLLIFSMAKLAESRDLETGYHLERIRHYSAALAQKFAETSNSGQEIDNLFLENIFLTSPLHDIGKIGIPDHILLKAERLDPDEFEIIKNHTLIGYDTLSQALEKQPKADYLRMGAEIAQSHHERMDGGGYPQGLKGSQIPLSARIVALADVYDALVSKRRYKDAYSHAVAKAIIIKDKNTHFDPLLVDAFLHYEDRFIEIFQEFKDPAGA